MNRAYVSISGDELNSIDDHNLLGQLASNLPFAIEPDQTRAWEYQIRHLRNVAANIQGAHFFLEFLVPRMGRRVDLIVLYKGIIFVVEYKIGSRAFDRPSLEQVFGYGIDLKNFHETSHKKPIVPILLATQGNSLQLNQLQWDDDFVARPLRSSSDNLSQIIQETSRNTNFEAIDPILWMNGRYRPTPTIIEAAQYLYRGHNVGEISRSEAGVENLTITVNYLAQAIEFAKKEMRKIICFITGVPGSGKTLAGLNLATSRHRCHEDENAVFLSGNGPLVDVLKEALVIDALSQAKEKGINTIRRQEEIKTDSFIQNIHHFRDEALRSGEPPYEKVAIFDEAQRAWNLEQTSRFMQRKRKIPGFSMSEPHFLLSVMDRHHDWCAIICLVGEGQEINTGEAGINEWLRVLVDSFNNWKVYLPPNLVDPSLTESSNYGLSSNIIEKTISPELHLATSIRSFRAERLSDFVAALINGNSRCAADLAKQLFNYPLFITRNIDSARFWLKRKRRAGERAGLLASSNAARLKPHGIFVKSKIEAAKWFLASQDDVRSSDALEDVATEFDVQGLELDWACVCWEANFRRSSHSWEFLKFRGTRWENVGDKYRQEYIANSYRVLLTRARQGLIVFVPNGDIEDPTRPPEVYDLIYNFLKECGFQDH